MKKIIGIVFLALVATGAFFGYRYYQNTYVGSTYFALVPDNLEKTDIKSDRGEVMGQGYKYELTAYNESGEAKEISFSIITDGDNRTGQAYPAGTFLKVEASNTRVIKQQAVEKDQVPAKVLELLQNNQ